MMAIAGCDTAGSDSASGPDPTFEATAAVASAAVAGSGADDADSYLRATLTVDFDATVISDTPMYDVQTGRSTTQMVLDSPPARFDVMAGYDTQGRFVYDQVALDPVGDPLTESVDEVRRTRIRNGVVELYDALGTLLTDGSAPPTLSNVFGTTSADPLVILDGVVVSSFPAEGSKQSRSGSTATVTNVSQSGNKVTVTSTVSSTDALIPDLPQRRVYVQSGSEYVLSEVQTDVSTTTAGTRVTGQASIRLANVTWKRNVSKDNARRTSSGPNPWAVAESQTNLAPAPCTPPLGPGDPDDYDSPECETRPPGYPESNPCELTPDGAHITYVHGILSDGAAWGSGPSGQGLIGEIRCELRIASESAPTLTTDGTGRHTEQATQLLSHVQGLETSDRIFVAHSQGGLISRRVAQSTWGRQAGKVRAVVTTGTPHTGAPIANTLNPGPGTNAFVNAFSGATGAFSVCRISDCGWVKGGLLALRDGFLAGVYSSPAMSDLKPGSQAIRAISVTESFPRYGIQHAIPKRWAIAQVGGDLTYSNDGVRTREIVRNVFHIAVAAAVVSGIVSFFAPWAAPYAAAAAFVASTLNSTDRWWTRITVGNDQGDGVVPYASQVYPRATFNYRAPNPVSHTAEVDTRRSALSVRDVLRDRVGVSSRRSS